MSHLRPIIGIPADRRLLDGLGDVMSAPAIPYRGGYLNPDPGDTAEGDALAARCMRSEDYAEGRRAFMEKRPPKFRGR